MDIHKVLWEVNCERKLAEFFRERLYDEVRDTDCCHWDAPFLAVIEHGSVRSDHKSKPIQYICLPFDYFDKDEVDFVSEFTEYLKSTLNREIKVKVAREVTTVKIFFEDFKPNV